MIKILVANKTDLLDASTVTFAEAEDYAETIDAPILEASAKENIGIDEIFI